MKTRKNLLASFTLTLFLALSAYNVSAGVIPMPGSPSEPLEPAPTPMQTTPEPGGSQTGTSETAETYTVNVVLYILELIPNLM